MTRSIRWMLPFFAAAMLTIGATACEKDGPAERTGEKIDETAEKAGDQMEEFADEFESETDSH